MASGLCGGLLTQQMLHRPRHNVLRIPWYFAIAARADVGLVGGPWGGDVVLLPTGTDLDAIAAPKGALRIKLFMGLAVWPLVRASTGGHEHQFRRATARSRRAPPSGMIPRIVPLGRALRPSSGTYGRCVPLEARAA